jgi:iron complex outermembrane recepter protein
MLNSASKKRARGAMLISTCVAAAVSSGPAFAQKATPADAAQPAPAAPSAEVAPANPVTETDILVTGTRVVRDGYKAPTPTSVIGAQEIAAKAPTNLADYVNELPSLVANNTPRSNVGFVSAGLVGINALNLRNLGPTRTLVLLNGQRVAASTLTGFVDINTIPQALVKRVDVVTGGASAGWGSDAVAGVVNFVLDDQFKGLKGSVQGGITTYGDDPSVNLSLTGGTDFAEGRGHLVLSAEYAYNQGIRSIGDRQWYNGAKLFFNPAYNAVTNNTVPQLINLPNVGFATATPGGLITTGPLRGTYFGPGGVPAQFNYGPIVSGNFMQGGDWRYADFSLSGDLSPRTTRQGYFGGISFKISDDVQVYGQLSYNLATARVATLNQFNFGNIVIQPDNAFIPASIRPQVTAPFNLGTFNADMGPIIANTRRSATRGVVGVKGRFDALGSTFSWDVYAQRSTNNIYTDAVLSITSRYNAAIDSVTNSNGAIVCRSTLANPTNGCVPYNIFGTGVVSQAALNYVQGRSFGRTKLSQNVVAATLRGDPFSTWAGPVSIATGIEHRTEEVSGSNDALSATRSFFAGNYLASFGSYKVTEGFLEAVVPLAKDAPFAHALDLNGAVRYTNYSTSGGVTTWKLGVTYSPVEDITFRATRSRDIRAPNLAELFQSGQTSTTVLNDPFRNNAATTLFQVTSGNLALQPEKADTLGLGVVLQPTFLPGFAASVDYYEIRVRDSISTINAATLVNQCFIGNTLFCGQITRAVGGTLINNLPAITSVAVIPNNVARQVNRGLDIEASYRRPVLGGNLTIRGLATRYLENLSADGITPATDTVGTNGMNGTLKNSLPKWRYTASVSWDSEKLLLSLTGRGFSSGVYNTSYVECGTTCPPSTPANMTINNNRLPGAFYLDGSVTVRFPHNIEAFFAVDNIANKDPFQMAYGPTIGTAPISVNPVLYDVVGRSFRAGFRFKM